MTRAVGRAAAAAALGALAGAAWLAFFYVLHPDLRVELDVTPPARLVTGMYPAERERDSGLTFAWTGSAATIWLPGLDRHVDWTLTIRTRGARPGDDNPDLAFFVDGVLVASERSTTDFAEIRVPVPARPQRMGASVDMRVSNTFVPGPSDPRPLGVQADWLRLSPAGIALPPRAAFAGIVLASAAFGAAFALIGVTAGSAVGAIILVSAAQAALVARGFGTFTTFPDTLAGLAVWTGAAAVVSTAGLQVVRRKPLRNTARFVVAFSASAFLLKAGVLLHPDMPIGDALFHAHRYRTVAAGNLYFTSIAPGNYLFPYAPGLYVFALPFSVLLPRAGADVSMLRLIVLGVDAVAAVLLYGMAVRAWQNRLAGACAVALYHLVPLDFRTATVGNLTNAFAQSLCVGVLAAAAATPLRAERRLAVAGFALLLTSAFLSHLSAFAIFAVAVAVMAVLYWWRGGPALHSAAIALLVGLAVAVAAAVGLYYAHFMDTYRTELARIGAETATAAPAPGGRSILDRIVAVPRDLRLYLGLPTVVLGAIGSWTLWRGESRDRLTLTMAGLGIACVAFVGLGIVTPVDMRHYLAIIPALALAAGLAASQLWASERWRRGAALVLLAWAASIGVRTWWDTLR